MSASFIADLLWLSHLLRSVSTKKNTKTTKIKHHVPCKIDSEGYGALLESTSCGVLLELRQCFLATWGWQLKFFEGHLVKAPLLSSLRFSMGVATHPGLSREGHKKADIVAGAYIWTLATVDLGQRSPNTKLQTPRQRDNRLRINEEQQWFAVGS